jgi:ribulose 1,5-bisphosphate carboxylase large subunit-like protein
MQDNDLRRLRGKSAIDAAHEGITGEDEVRLDSAISALYGVDGDEALEIHANYHIDRIFAQLVQRARQNGMKKSAIAKRLAGLDFNTIGSQVAVGKLAEAAAVDLLFRQLANAETRTRPDDRYIQFYG